MKKILFSLVAVATFSFANAQTKISFESSEGYALGSVNEQNDWATWTFDDSLDASTFGNVVTPGASNGVNYLALTSEGAENNFIGAEKNILVDANNNQVTFDMKVDNLGGIDSFVSFYDADYAELLSIDFAYDGSVGIGQFWDLGYDGLEYSGEYEAGEWVSFKVIFNFDNSNAEVFVNNDSIGVVSFDATFSKAEIIDVFHDDYEPGYGFGFDNLSIDKYLSVNDINKNSSIKVYPNPAVDFVTVDTTAKISSVEVYDLAGKLVKSVKDGSKTVNVSSLEKGNYVVKVNTTEGSFTKKVIKK